MLYLFVMNALGHSDINVQNSRKDLINRYDPVLASAIHELDKKQH